MPPPDRPVKLTRHADHDPALICRPALGYGLCEVLPDGVGVKSWREVLDDLARQDARSIIWGCPAGCRETHTRPHGAVLGDEERSDEKTGSA